MIYLIADEKMKKRFKLHFRNLTDSLEEARAVLIVRGSEVSEKMIDDVIIHTEASVPIVIMTGELDEKGMAFQRYAEENGIEEVLTGTEWRMSAVQKELEKVLKDPKLPDAKVFIEQEDHYVFREKEIIEEPLELRTKAKLVIVHGFNGGTGVTTVATSLASFYRARGLKTLLLDVSNTGDAAFHYGSAPNNEVLKETGFGDLFETKGERNVVQKGLERNVDIIVADVPSYSPYKEELLDLAHRIVTVVNPSELDYMKLEAYTDRIDERHLLIVNRIDETKPLRYSFVHLMRSLAGGKLVEIEESDGVASAFAERKPAYLRHPFDYAIAKLAAELNLD